MARILFVLSTILGVHSTQYNFSVSEDMAVGMYIGKVTLPGVQPNCSYTIMGSNKFGVDPSGRVYTTAVLDREVQPDYALRVVCDNSTTPFAEMTVEVTDLNDNAPSFSQSLYTFDIRENTIPGTTIGKVSAVDADVGLNGAITYRKQPNGDFRIHSTTGLIILTTQPTESLYVIRVTAQDDGLPPKSTTCLVYIIVPRSYTFNVLESVPVHSSIGSVFKVPSGMDAAFSGIRISPHVPFALDLNDDKGSLYTLTLLDWEITSIYQFRVWVSTSGVESLLANVTVNVFDVNDNVPVFSRRWYNVTVNADPPGLSAFLTVQATDMDSGSQLSYSIVTKSGPQPFAIDPMTGTLSVIHTLDQPSYAVLVQVSDGMLKGNQKTILRYGNN